MTSTLIVSLRAGKEMGTFARIMLVIIFCEASSIVVIMLLLTGLIHSVSNWNLCNIRHGRVKNRFWRRRIRALHVFGVRISVVPVVRQSQTVVFYQQLLDFLISVLIAIPP